MNKNIILCGVGGQGTVLASGYECGNDRYGTARRKRIQPRKNG